MTKILTLLCAALALSFPAYAEDAHHPDKQQDKPAAAAKVPAKPAPSGAKAPMGGQMGMDCPMQKGSMGMMGRGGNGAEHEAMMARMHQLEKRMDMMQMMMEQMSKSAAPAK